MCLTEWLFFFSLALAAILLEANGQLKGDASLVAIPLYASRTGSGLQALFFRAYLRCGIVTGEPDGVHECWIAIWLSNELSRTQDQTPFTIRIQPRRGKNYYGDITD